jgi:hypothetical protein
MEKHESKDVQSTGRREALKLSLGSVLAGLLATRMGSALANAHKRLDAGAEESIGAPKAFVYTELQISVPFEDIDWGEVNTTLQQVPGLMNKTWLSGFVNNSLGGLYAFNSIENAQKFVNGYLPKQGKSAGVGMITRIFDATIVAAASRDLNSPFFGSRLSKQPNAFVYTEVQLAVPFGEFPWRERNVALKKQKGLLAKTWFSGLHTNTLGGFDAFDTIENARAYALDDFPRIAEKLNAAFYTRVFDADIVASASKQMHSPFF